MAQTLIEKVLMWIFAILYGILTFANYARLSFKVGFKKFFSWKVIERPACLDDKTLGTHGYLHLEVRKICSSGFLTSLSAARLAHR